MQVEKIKNNMNRKVIAIGILLILANSCKTNAQEKVNIPIQKSIELFNSWTTETSKYELEFIEEKNTLYFKYELEEKRRYGFKAILEDIHPEGIFILKNEDKTFLRILSIHNGKVFVRERFRGQFRNSNNTNLIDIELPEKVDKQELDELVVNLKTIFVKEEKETPIQIIEAKN